MLELEGYDVVLSDDGLRGLAAAQRQRPDAIVLDLMMPVMDGKAFRDEQLRDPVLSKIPVLVISAYHDAETRASALNTQMAMKKPLDLDRFLDLVQQNC